MDRSGHAEPFTDSSGYPWVMNWGFCHCHIWYVAWDVRKDFAGRCGRCGEGVRYSNLTWTYEDVLERFRAEYGRNPAPL